jgi:hypothetical protein
LKKRFTKDELLTNVMIYYVTNSISSSIRLYWELAQNPATYQNAGKFYVPIPTGYALFKDLHNGVSESLMKYNYNLVLFSQMEEGGHFAAMEVPNLLAGEIRKFYKIVSKINKKEEL